MYVCSRLECFFFSNNKLFPLVIQLTVLTFMLAKLARIIKAVSRVQVKERKKEKKKSRKCQLRYAPIGQCIIKFGGEKPPCKRQYAGMTGRRRCVWQVSVKLNDVNVTSDSAVECRVETFYSRARSKYNTRMLVQSNHIL